MHLIYTVYAQYIQYIRGCQVHFEMRSAEFGIWKSSAVPPPKRLPPKAFPAHGEGGAKRRMRSPISP